MDGYSISQVAQETGFTASALRYYEQSGLLRPARTASGYRTYDDDDVELLRFVGRAKTFGLSLDDIAELLDVLADGKCAPVQSRLRELVDAKIADTQSRIAELLALTAELQRLAASLGLHTPDGPCDDSCGCTTTNPIDGVRLTAKPDPGADPPIACTLDPAEVDRRLADWTAVRATAEGTERTEGGIRLHLPPETDLAAVAALAAAEQTCCQFFTFGLTIGAVTTLDITGPPDSLPIIEALVGAPA